MNEYVRWGGFRVKHQGQYAGEGRYVDWGWLCGKNSNTEQDVRVMIYHVPQVGYVYKELC